MNRRNWPIYAVAFATMFVVATTASAQVYRSNSTIYFKPRAGVGFYGGDRDANPDNELSRFIELRGLHYGAEIGKQFNDRFGLGLAFLAGNFSGLDENWYPFAAPLDTDASSEWRYTPALIAHINFAHQKRVSPYIPFGAGVTFGKYGPSEAAASTEIAFTPIIGLGFDIALNDKWGFFVESDWLLPLPDDKFDGVEQLQTGVDGGGSGFDVVSYNTVGLRYNFTAACKPVSIVSATGPSDLLTGTDGTFEGSVAVESSQPVTHTWNFGDGGTASGVVATHSYGRAGTYTVTFTASNACGSDSRTMSVSVERPIVAPTIVTATASPLNPDTATPVQFSANVRGDAPITYTWDFGDGTTATGANATHTFTEPGTYTVTLTASNAGGSDTRTITVVVVPVEVDICAEIADLNSVFFDRNSSTLTTAGRAALQDNVEILNECPNINVLVEGLAAPGERNPQRLSTARARAVEKFYTDNGISPSRIVASGRGRPAGVTSKEGASQYRRVDSFPTR